MRENLSKEEFITALSALDKELMAVGYPGCVELRVIGGFALLWRGLRNSGVTADIDSISTAFDFQVQNAIKRVAERLELPPDWINNDAVFSFSNTVEQSDIEAFDAMLEASYERQDTEFEHITLSIADIDTLIKSKAYAVNDIGVGRTSKDLDDLMMLFKSQGLDNLHQIMDAYSWLNETEFSRCCSLLAELEGVDLGLSYREKLVQEIEEPALLEDEADYFRYDYDRPGLNLRL